MNELPGLRVRTYVGASPEESNQQYGTDALEAARYGYFPVAHSWAGPVLSVGYQQRQIATRRARPVWAGVAMVVGGVMVALGAFLPWVSLNLTDSPLDLGAAGDEWFLPLGVVIVVAGVLTAWRSTNGIRGLCIFGALVSVAYGVYEFTQVQDLLFFGPLSGVGPGFGIVCLGAVVAIVGAALARGPQFPVVPTQIV